MRMVKFMIPLALALIICAGAQAEEKKAGKGGSFMGTLAAKPADAKEGVIATLAIKHGKDEAKTVNVLGDADVAKSVADLAGKMVDVKGTETADGIKATAITEHKKKEKAPK